MLVPSRFEQIDRIRLELQGAGIVGASGDTGKQTFDNRSKVFFNSPGSTAANVHIINSGPSSQANFSNATADSATIENSGAKSGNTLFGNSTAANARITNSGAGSSTFINDFSTAGNAEIINSGTGSNVNFGVSAKSGNATILNSGAGSSSLLSGNKLRVKARC